MTKKEVMWLMDQIQSYYPNFDVTEARVDAWTRVFTTTEYRTALSNLTEYVSTEEKNTPPSVARLKRHPETDNYVSMRFIQHRGVMLWTPKGGETYEVPLTYHRGGYWTDDEGREYTFAETNAEYWDKLYGVEIMDSGETQDYMTKINANVGFELF